MLYVTSVQCAQESSRKNWTRDHMIFKAGAKDNLDPAGGRGQRE